MIMIATEQMELSLKSAPARPQNRRQKKAHDRSQWWFRRMHWIVDQADAWVEGSVRSSAQALLSLNLRRKGR